VLEERKYTDVIIQIGLGQFEPVNAAQDSNVKVDYFRYKDSIAEDIHIADLVISHAGRPLLILQSLTYCFNLLFILFINR